MSTAQLFFDEGITKQVVAMEPYVSHTAVQRVQNSNDFEFSKDSQSGYDPVISVIPLDEHDIVKGLIGYITLGVDTTAVEKELWSPM